MKIPPRFHWRLRADRVPRTPGELLALLLELRGVGRHDAEAFLAPPYEASLHDAALLPQLGPVVDRLQRALRSREPTTVFGDYDVDGITGAALVAEILTRLGGSVRVELPEREEGYGLSVERVRTLVPPTTLLITVDNGTSATVAVAEAVARGADVIILDHHAVHGALPAGALVVNPVLPSSRYPNRSLAAVGVAWKVAAALLAAEGKAGEETFLLDLVCLGTLADSVSLRGENRALVSWGLEVLRRSRRPGLQMLAEQVGLRLGDVTADALTFKLIPRLNAAGRLRSPRLTLDLLQTSDVGTARRLALELDAVNHERRTLTEELFSSITHGLPSEPPPMLWAAGPWPLGVLGILASRLSEEYQRPAVVVAIRDGECTASIRGDGVNVIDIVRELEELLTRFGGHAGAAGFSFPRSALDAVRAFFEDRPPLPESSREPVLDLDCPLPLDLATLDLASLLARLEPFGAGNERPVFLFPRVSVLLSRAIGTDGTHVRFLFRGERSLSGSSAVAFRWGTRPRPAPGDLVDVAAEVRLDHFRGVPRVDLHVRDLRAPLPVGAEVPRRLVAE